jgi:phage-related protein
MPRTEIRVFRDENGSIPIQEWLDVLESKNPKVYAKCLARILELEAKGNEMRRPHADMLRNGIYELRASFSRIHYRMLYFFFGRNVVILSHGLSKEDTVRAEDIRLAQLRREKLKRDPDKFTADFDI